MGFREGTLAVRVVCALAFWLGLTTGASHAETYTLGDTIYSGEWRGAVVEIAGEPDGCAISRWRDNTSDGIQLFYATKNRIGYSIFHPDLPYYVNDARAVISLEVDGRRLRPSNVEWTSGRQIAMAWREGANDVYQIVRGDRLTIAFPGEPPVTVKLRGTSRAIRTVLHCARNISPQRGFESTHWLGAKAWLGLGYDSDFHRIEFARHIARPYDGVTVDQDQALQLLRQAWDNGARSAGLPMAEILKARLGDTPDSAARQEIDEILEQVVQAGAVSGGEAEFKLYQRMLIAPPDETDQSRAFRRARVKTLLDKAVAQNHAEAVLAYAAALRSGDPALGLKADPKAAMEAKYAFLDAVGARAANTPAGTEILRQAAEKAFAKDASTQALRRSLKYFLSFVSAQPAYDRLRYTAEAAPAVMQRAGMGPEEIRAQMAQLDPEGLGHLLYVGGFGVPADPQAAVEVWRDRFDHDTNRRRARREGRVLAPDLRTFRIGLALLTAAQDDALEPRAARRILDTLYSQIDGSEYLQRSNLGAFLEIHKAALLLKSGDRALADAMLQRYGPDARRVWPSSARNERVVDEKESLLYGYVARRLASGRSHNWRANALVRHQFRLVRKMSFAPPPVLFQQAATAEAERRPRRRAAPLQALRERATVASARALVRRYGSLPGGVVLESDKAETVSVSQAIYEADTETFLLQPGGLRYAPSVAVEEMLNILSSLQQDDRMGVSLTRDAVIDMNALEDDSAVRNALALADMLLAAVAFNNPLEGYAAPEADELRSPERAGSGADPQSGGGQAATHNVSAVFQLDHHGFETVDGALLSKGATLRATLAPTQETPAADGGALPDEARIAAGPPQAFEANLDLLLSNIAYHRREPAFARAEAYAEAAAFARMLIAAGIRATDIEFR